MGIACMGIDIHRDTCIRMAHQVLQTFQVYPGICHVGAEGMLKYMRCDLRQRLIRMQLAVLFQCPLEMMLDVHRNLWITVLVQQQETGITVDGPFLRGLLSVCNSRAFLLCCIHYNEGRSISRMYHKTKNPGSPFLVTRDKTYSDTDLVSEIFPLRGSQILTLGFSVCRSFLETDGKFEVQLMPPQF